MYVTTFHLISLTATLVLVTIVGLLAARKVKTASDFAVGGHASGSVLVAGTIVGTMVGGSATIGTAQLAFSYGITAWWFTLGAGTALLLLSVFYAKPLRASGLQTIPQFLVMHFGPAAGPLTSIASSLGIFFSVVANILSAIPLLVAMFGFASTQAAGLVVFLIIAYVFFGGVWGTGMVGVVKTGLMFLSLGGIVISAFSGMGGVSGYQAAFPAFPWFSLFARGIWIDLASGLSLVVGTLTTQTYIQAVYAAKNEKAARNGALLAALITLPTGIPAIMAGMYMRVHHPDIAAIDALPQFIISYLPPWLGGIAIATLLLAAIGSAAGLALGVGTMVSRDILACIWRFSDVAMLKVNRFAVFGVTLGAALFSFGNLKSLVLEWNFLSMGLRGAGLFLPLTLAVFFPGRVSRMAAIASMAAGAGISFAWKLVGPAAIDPLYAGLLASAAALLIVSLCHNDPITAAARAGKEHAEPNRSNAL